MSHILIVLNFLENKIEIKYENYPKDTALLILGLILKERIIVDTGAAVLSLP